jgi:hypothetical protein
VYSSRSDFSSRRHSSSNRWHSRHAAAGNAQPLQQRQLLVVVAGMAAQMQQDTSHASHRSIPLHQTQTHALAPQVWFWFHAPLLIACLQHATPNTPPPLPPTPTHTCVPRTRCGSGSTPP